MMVIGDLPCAVGNASGKSGLNKMIDKLGFDETVRRIAWLYEEHEEKVSQLIVQYLNDDYIDDKGIKGGDFFWGDL